MGFSVVRIDLIDRKSWLPSGNKSDRIDPDVRNSN